MIFLLLFMHKRSLIILHLIWDVEHIPNSMHVGGYLSDWSVVSDKKES